MRSLLNNVLKIAATALVASLPFLATETQAMPSFARQTGMVCNSCHIGTDNVPNFTRTGRIFAMRGYTRPIMREKLRTDGQAVDGELQYGGDYLALNWMDFFAARLVSEVVQGGKSNAGVKNDVTSKPLARMALFYTGPITDWLGLWTEIAYLGNNDLDSVSTATSCGGNTCAGPTGLNLFAYDEYRLSTSRTVGENSFIGMSLGNEPGDVVTQFVFPGATGSYQYFSTGQGGTGQSMDMATLSLHALWDDRWWTQVAFTSGQNNLSWSNGWDQYYALAYDFFRQTDNDLWLSVEVMRGNDTSSILTSQKYSYLCPTTCPAGVTDSQLSITTTLGGTPVVNAPVESVKKYNTYRLKAEHVVADRGSHSWVAALQFAGIKQDFVSGGSAKHDSGSLYLRYFYNRTYGFEANYRHNFDYWYKTPGGTQRDVKMTNLFQMVLLWNPAMNFSTHLTYNPKTFNWVFKDTDSALYADKGNSWGLGFEYSF